QPERRCTERRGTRFRHQPLAQGALDSRHRRHRRDAGIPGRHRGVRGEPQRIASLAAHRLPRIAPDRSAAMIKVKRLGHATFETPDLDRLTDYYIGVVGLVPLVRGKDRVMFVSRLGDLSVILHRATAPQLTRLAFQVGPNDELAALARMLANEGIRASVDTASLPGIEKLLRFEDLKRTTTHLFNEARPAAGVSDPAAVGPTKLGHVAFMMPDIHPHIAFYQKVLGFRVSDWQEDFFCFMRCNTDHHTINFATGKSTRMHHMAFELKDW